MWHIMKKTTVTKIVVYTVLPFYILSLLTKVDDWAFTTAILH